MDHSLIKLNLKILCLIPVINTTKTTKMDTNVFDKTDIMDGVTTSKYSRDTEFIPVSFLRDSSNGDRLENKMLKLFILNCTIGHNNEIKRITQFSKFGNKKAKFNNNNQSSPFNRMFICADLRQPPKVCAVIVRNGAELNVLVKLVGGLPFVGTTFFLYEPGLITATLGDHTPILDWKSSPFIPVRYPQEQLSSTANRMKLPTYAGQTSYFVLTEQRITLTSVMLSPYQSCLGVQCDRQKSKDGCSCVHASNHSGHIYDCCVTFDVNPAMDPSRRITVSNFQSYKFTKLFFENFEDFVQSNSWPEIDDSQNLIRRKWTSMVNYVNEHGGWTLVGWSMLGDHYDAANGQDKVQAAETKIHLSSLQPTQRIELMNNAELRRVKINHDFVTISHIEDSDSDSD